MTQERLRVTLLERRVAQLEHQVDELQRLGRAIEVLRQEVRDQGSATRQATIQAAARVSRVSGGWRPR